MREGNRTKRKDEKHLTEKEKGMYSMPGVKSACHTSIKGTQYKNVMPVYCQGTKATWHKALMI